MHSYKLIERVLKEQCNLNVSDDQKRVEVKKPKEIASDSLQNPSDPDNTYSGHKGQGYQVQVMETYTDTKDQEVKSKTLNLVTQVEVEKACESDAKALIPAIESTQKRGLGSKEFEATMSELDRRTGVKRLRVRGFKAVRFSATLKAIGIHLFRDAAVPKAANYDNADNSRIKSALNHAIFFVNEQFRRIFSPL